MLKICFEFCLSKSWSKSKAKYQAKRKQTFKQNFFNMAKDIKDFVKYLTEVSDNHGIRQEERLDAFCDFIISLFSTDSYKPEGFKPDVATPENNDYIALVSLWCEMVAEEMEKVDILPPLKRVGFLDASV